MRRRVASAKVLYPFRYQAKFAVKNPTAESANECSKGSDHERMQRQYQSCELELEGESESNSMILELIQSRRVEKKRRQHRTMMKIDERIERSSGHDRRVGDHLPCRP